VNDQGWLFPLLLLPLAPSIHYATEGIQTKCFEDITLYLDMAMAEGLHEW